MNFRLKKIIATLSLSALMATGVFAELDPENPFNGKTSLEAKTLLDTEKTTLATAVSTKKTELSALIKANADQTTINAKLQEVLDAAQSLENMKTYYSLFRLDLKEQRSALTLAQKAERDALNAKIKVGGGSVEINGVTYTFKGRDQLKAEKDAVRADLKAERAANTALNKTERDDLKGTYTADLTTLKNTLDKDLAEINARVSGGSVDMGDGTKVVYDKNTMTKIRVNMDDSPIDGEVAEAYTGLTANEAKSLTLTKQTNYSVAKTQRKAQYEVDKTSLKATQDMRKQAITNKNLAIKEAVTNGGTVTVNGTEHTISSSTTNKDQIAAMKAALKEKQTTERANIK